MKIHGDPSRQTVGRKVPAKAPTGTESKPVSVVIQKKEKKRKPQGISRLYPAKKFITMIYEENSALQTGTSQSTFGGVTTPRIYNLNSITAPRPTGGTVRPQGWNQVFDVYSRYKVYGAHVRVTFNNPPVDGVYCGVRAQESGGTDALAGETLTTAPSKKWTIAEPLNNTGTQTYTYDRYWDIGLMDGLTKNQFNSDVVNYQSLMTASPVRIPFLELEVANSANDSDLQVNYSIRIEYYVQIFGRKVLPTSTI